MANVDSAFGFRPINMDGSPYNGATGAFLQQQMPPPPLLATR
jgi:hypothetical protein